jgi:hypothetical protein
MENYFWLSDGHPTVRYLGKVIQIMLIQTAIWFPSGLKNGENWSKNPELIYAHPFGGSQDPCLLQLRDGTSIMYQLWLGLSQA